VSFFAGSLALGTVDDQFDGDRDHHNDQSPGGNFKHHRDLYGDGNFNPDTAAAISVSVGSPSFALTVGQRR